MNDGANELKKKCKLNKGHMNPKKWKQRNDKIRKLRQASLPSELRKTKGMKVRTYISMVQQTIRQLDELDPSRKQLVSSVRGK